MKKTVAPIGYCLISAGVGVILSAYLVDAKFSGSSVVVADYLKKVSLIFFILGILVLAYAHFAEKKTETSGPAVLPDGE